MQKKTIHKKRFTMRLRCDYCGQFFNATRFRKYHDPECSRLANIAKGQFRYREMRKIVLKARGKTK